MQRVLEPELMEDSEQVVAYAEADFEEPHNEFIYRIKNLTGAKFSGAALDLGCGPGDISRRFAKAYPYSRIDAVDGSRPMIDYAIRITDSRLAARVQYIHGKLPEAELPNRHYDLIFSNSLLHHLTDPQVLWKTVIKYAKPAAYVFIMDLLRPHSREQAEHLVEHYAAAEPEILKRDFFQSLLAAFTLAEIEQQLEEAGLPLSCQQISDRHVFVSGIIH